MIAALVILAAALAAATAAAAVCFVRWRDSEVAHRAAERELERLAAWVVDARTAVQLEHDIVLDDLVAAHRIPTYRYHRKENP